MINANNLMWLSEWYDKNCDNDWEHYYGIKIETIDNPGWSIIIDIKNFPSEKIQSIPWIFVENTEIDWYGYKIEQGKFEASGDPLKLEFLINLFRGIIEDSIK